MRSAMPAFPCNIPAMRSLKSCNACNAFCKNCNTAMPSQKVRHKTAMPAMPNRNAPCNAPCNALITACNACNIRALQPQCLQYHSQCVLQCETAMPAMFSAMPNRNARNACNAFCNNPQCLQCPQCPLQCLCRRTRPGHEP